MTLRILKFIGLGAAILLVVSCFLPWITIPTRDLMITGVDTSGTNFGKPGYFHLLMAGLFITCLLIPRIAAKRLNLLITALNIAWALRNFLVIPSCSGGECPDKEAAIYLLLFSSVLMLVAAFFPDMKIRPTQNGTIS